MAEGFQYALLRAVPSIERGEALNVGVVVHCRRAGFLGVRTAVDEARLRLLDPGIDVAAVDAHLGVLERVAAGDEPDNPIAALDRSDRFGWMVAPVQHLGPALRRPHRPDRRPRGHARAVVHRAGPGGCVSDDALPPGPRRPALAQTLQWVFDPERFMRTLPRALRQHVHRPAGAQRRRGLPVRARGRQDGVPGHARGDEHGRHQRPLPPRAGHELAAGDRRRRAPAPAPAAAAAVPRRADRRALRGDARGGRGGRGRLARGRDDDAPAAHAGDDAERDPGGRVRPGARASGATGSGCCWRACWS